MSPINSTKVQRIIPYLLTIGSGLIKKVETSPAQDVFQLPAGPKGFDWFNQAPLTVKAKLFGEPAEITQKKLTRQEFNDVVQNLYTLVSVHIIGTLRRCNHELTSQFRSFLSRGLNLENHTIQNVEELVSSPSFREKITGLQISLLEAPETMKTNSGKTAKEFLAEIAGKMKTLRLQTLTRQAEEEATETVMRNGRSFSGPTLHTLIPLETNIPVVDKEVYQLNEYGEMGENIFTVVSLQLHSSDPYVSLWDKSLRSGSVRFTPLENIRLKESVDIEIRAARIRAKEKAISEFKEKEDLFCSLFLV